MNSKVIVTDGDAVETDPLNVTRRRVLQMIAASGAASSLGLYAFFGPGATTASASGTGYGIDPDLMEGRVTWGHTLTSAQLDALEILGDILIPEDEHSPKASDLNISDFVNEWLSAPYPTQREDRRIVLNGLDWLERAAQSSGGHGFVESGAKQQAALVEELAMAVAKARASEEQTLFFERLVFIFVGGFYTTQEGMKDIGYVGNVPLPRFDGPPADIRARLGL